MSVDFNPNKILSVVRESFAAGLASLSLEIAGDIEENVLRKKTNPGPKYRNPSKPGNPPAVRTGQLANRMLPITSSDADTSVTGRTSVNAVVYNTAPYAAFLEFGTRYMAPRPFLAPSMNKRKNRYKKILKEEIVFELNRRIAR